MIFSLVINSWCSIDACSDASCVFHFCKISVEKNCTQEIGQSLRAAAGALDFFSLWYWGLVVLGLAGLAGMSTRRFLMPVGALWALGVLIRATFPFLGGNPA